MEAVDTPLESGTLRRRRRAAGVSALAGAALLVAGSGVVILALRAARVREAVRAIQETGGVVTWDYELALLLDDTFPPEEREGLWTAVLFGNPRMDPNHDGRAWLRRLLGPEWLQDVAAVQFFPWSEQVEASPFEGAVVHLVAFPRLKQLDLIGVQSTDRTLEIAGGLRGLERLTVEGNSLSDEGLRHLKHLSRLRSLYVEAPITDRGVEHLKGLTRLEELSLVQCPLTDGGLASLAGLINLRKLDIYLGRITDAGLRHLMPLGKLEALSLEGTPLTDGSIEALLELKSLKSLYFNTTRITEKGIEMLRAGQPGLRVGVGREEPR